MSGVIKINPDLFSDKRDAMAVAWDEALRLFMEDTGFEPAFEVTPDQQRFFNSTAYGDDPDATKKTIVARIATFDTSIKSPTPEQVAETIRLLESAIEVFDGQPDGETLKAMRAELESANKDIKGPAAQSPTQAPDGNIPGEMPQSAENVPAQEHGLNDPRRVQSAEGGGGVGAAKKVSWSSAVMDYLTKAEGFRSTAYPDPAGQTSRWAVGYGNQFHPGQKRPVKKGDTVNPAKAKLYMADAVAYNVDKLRSSVGEDKWGALTGGQKLALTSWAYNVGETNVRESTLAKRMRRGESAADIIRQELPKWHSKGTARARRAEELEFAESDLYE